MTEKTIKSKETEQNNDTVSFKKLSIQVSLNGLSFFVLDTIANKVIVADHVDFKTETTPYLLQKELKNTLKKHDLTSTSFSEVTVIHRNDMFALVPKSLFDIDELPNYLKFNTKLLANDEIAYDELKNHEIVTVYVPFTNINNYVFDLFGEFDFTHNSTVVLLSLFNQKIGSKPVCYVHVSKNNFELAVFDQKRLVLFNQFQFKTKEDFLYYLLFTYEQLNLDTESVKLKLFGAIEEGDELYCICYEYIKKVVVFEPNKNALDVDGNESTSIDFTLLSSF